MKMSLTENDGRIREFDISEIILSAPPPPLPAPSPVDDRPIYTVAPGDGIPLGANRRILFARDVVYEVKTSLYCAFANLSLEGPPNCPKAERPVIRLVNVPPPPVWTPIIDCRDTTENFTQNGVISIGRG